MGGSRVSGFPAGLANENWLVLPAHILRTDPVAANEEQQQGDHGAHCAAKRQARANAMDAPGTSRLTASRDEPGSGGVRVGQTR
jgi:hypothetical protein